MSRTPDCTWTVPAALATTLRGRRRRRPIPGQASDPYVDDAVAVDHSPDQRLPEAAETPGHFNYLLPAIGEHLDVESGEHPVIKVSSDLLPAGAASSNLSAIASAALLEPAPLVTLVRSLTVEKLDLIGLVVRRWRQCSAG